MPGVPHRFDMTTPQADFIAQLNDNFDKIVQDTGDLGSKLSNIGTTSITIAAGAIGHTVVHVTDERPEYVAGKTPVGPRVDCWVDTNNDDNFLLPTGASLSGGQLKVIVAPRVSRRAFTNTNEVASWFIQIYNFDSSQHVYYLSIDHDYQQSPPEGTFR